MIKIWNFIKLIVLVIFQLQFYLFVGGAMVISLFNPYFQDGRWIATAGYLMALQFFFIHSGAFMGVIFATSGKDKFARTNIMIWLGLLLVYSLFVFALYLTTKNQEILIAFGMLMLVRFINQIVFRQEEFSRSLMISSGLGAVFFLFWAGVILVGGVSFPRFGLTDAALAELNIPEYAEGMAITTIAGFNWALAYFISTGFFEGLVNISLDLKRKK